MMLRRAITGAAAPLTLYGAACCSSAEERKELKQTLTSVASKIFVESWQADQVSAQLGSESWSVKKERLHGGRQEGVDVISVDNGRLAFTVVPTRGMSIGDLAFRRSGVEGDRMESLSWASPVREVVHPREIELNDTGGLGWLTGFNEFIVRCGVAHAGHPGHDDGKLLTLHGRIGNIPASEVKVTIDADAPHTIRVCGRVDEQMFKFHDFELWTEVSTVPGSNTLTVSDRLVNRSSYEKEYQMIYHTNFGPGAGLESGAQFVAPVATVAPFDAAAAADLGTWNKYLGPTRDFGERCYKLTNHADEQGVSQVALISSDGQRGVSLKYTEANLPAFTLWKNTDTMEQGYVTGLEPGTSFCHPRPMERKAGRLPILGPGEEVQFVIQISALDGPKVVAARNEIEALRKGRNPQVVEG
eukprot:scaffold157458_cov35-Tisochrysis_lutea.AAC.1